MNHSNAIARDCVCPGSRKINFSFANITYNTRRLLPTFNCQQPDAEKIAGGPVRWMFGQSAINLAVLASVSGSHKSYFR